MGEFLKVGGVICRYVLAALACWWFFWFLALIGQSAEHSQELAGMAFGKAIVCGAAAASWFYRARKSKQGPRLRDHSVEAIQSASPVDPNASPTPLPTDQTRMILPPNAVPDSRPPIVDPPTQSENAMSSVQWAGIGLTCAALLVGLIIAVAVSNKPVQSKPTNSLDDYLRDQKQGAPSVASCPVGLPAGVEIVPIDDLTKITASDGQLWHEPVGDREAWHFSFKILNQTAVSSSDRTFEGYCITGLALVVSVQGEDGNTYDIQGRQYLTSPYVYLSPGWTQEVKDLALGLYRVPHNGSLSSWKITKAWGFTLNADGGHNK